MKVIDSLFKAYNITMANRVRYQCKKKRLKMFHCFTLGFRICERIEMTPLDPDLCVGILDPDLERKIIQKLLR
jgi:hypothetical protein